MNQDAVEPSEFSSAASSSKFVDAHSVVWVRLKPSGGLAAKLSKRSVRKFSLSISVGWPQIYAKVAS